MKYRERFKVDMNKDNEYNKQPEAYYRNLAEQMLCRIFTPENLESMHKSIKAKDKFRVEYGRGGSYLPLGYYCPSLIRELIVTNVKRGKLLKRLSKKVPDYCYYFDADELVLVQKNDIDTRTADYEWISRKNNTVFSLVQDANGDPDRLTVSIYHDNHISKNFFLVPLTEGDFILDIEEYLYNRDNRLISAVWKSVQVLLNELYEDVYEIDFVYKYSGLAGYYINKDKEFFYTMPSYLKELITGQTVQRVSMDLAKELKKRLLQSAQKWKDVGAISIFINGDGGFLSELSLTYTTETDFKTMDENTFEELFLDEEEVNLQQYIECAEHGDEEKAVLKAAVKAVGEIQQEDLLRNQFGHPVPVIIHGYEYTGKEIKATRRANPNGEADEFIDMLKRIGAI